LPSKNPKKVGASECSLPDFKLNIVPRVSNMTPGFVNKQ